MRRKYESLVIVLALSSSGWNISFSQDAENPRNPVGLTPLPRPTVVLIGQAVRQELKITEEQELKINAVLQKAREEIRNPPGRELAKLSQEERRARFDELSRMRDAADRDATGILTTEQLARLRQIQLWLDRAAALFNAEVIAELKLVSVQTDALLAIYGKHQEKRQNTFKEAFRKFKGTAEEKQKWSELAANLRKEFEEESLGVLTGEQREQFDKMCGPKFEAKRSEFRE